MVHGFSKCCVSFSLWPYWFLASFLEIGCWKVICAGMLFWVTAWLCFKALGIKDTKWKWLRKLLIFNMDYNGYMNAIRHGLSCLESLYVELCGMGDGYLINVSCSCHGWMHFFYFGLENSVYVDMGFVWFMFWKLDKRRLCGMYEGMFV